MNAMALAALLMLAPQHPRPEVPAVGTEVDRTIEVSLPTAVAGPTVTIAAGGASVVIPRPLLEQLAAKAGSRWETEEERQALIAADRAIKLLDQAASAAATGASLGTGALGDAAYLLAQVLEAGKALVIPDGTRSPLSRIFVRFSGNHPGPRVGFGRVTFYLPEPPREFFSVSWFVS